MRPTRRSGLAILAAVLLSLGCTSEAPSTVLDRTSRFDEATDLPPPDTTGRVPLEQVLRERRSRREYADTPLPLEIVGQLFWAGQGITDDAGHRTSPSAGARYPLELYALTRSTFMHYLPDGHRVEQRPDDRALSELAGVAFGQGFVAEAPLVVLIVGVQARTEAEYGAVAGDLVNRESGHAAQNVLLQATALGLAAVPVGGFDPDDVARLVALPPGHEVLYLVPVGFPIGHGGDSGEP